MPSVQAGNLRHKVALQAQQETRDSTTGEVLVTWQTVANVWAQIVPLSGKEFLAAQQMQSEVRGRIVIRYRASVDATMRVVYRGKYYNILAVLPDAESGIEHLTLMVSEGVNLG